MTYEIRPLSFGELLDTGFRLLRNHFSLLVGLGLVVYAPVILAQLALPLVLPTAAETTPEQVQAVLPLLIGGGVLVALWAIVAWPVASAAITHAVGELYLGRPTSFSNSLRVGWSLILPLAGTTLLSAILISLGLVLLVIPGIYLMLSYSLAWPVMVLERVFGMAALRRSRDLVRGNLLRMVGLFTVVAVLSGIIGGVVGFTLGAIPVVGELASGIVQAITSAFTAALSVVFYFDVRCRKEAFDLEHLARLVEQGPGAPLPAPSPLAG